MENVNLNEKRKFIPKGVRLENTNYWHEIDINPCERENSTLLYNPKSKSKENSFFKSINIFFQNKFNWLCFKF